MRDPRFNSKINLLAEKYGTILLAVFLSISAVLSISSALRKSVTVDEYALLPNGIAIIKEQAFHIDTGVPPLPKVLFALPVLLTPARFDTSAVAKYKTSWQCGIQFANENPKYYHDYFSVGRAVSKIALLFTILFTYGLASSLYGTTGGLLAAFFASLSPNLLAHGRLTTTDIYLTAAVIATLWAFDFFLKKPNFKSSSILGVSVGLACLCKLSGVLLLFILPLSLLFVLIMNKRNPGGDNKISSINSKTVIWGFVTLAAATLLINIGYLFQGTFTPVGEFHFSVPLLQTIQQFLPSWLPVPLPYHFISGFDVQLSETGYNAYLLGKFNNNGFWNYYFVAFLVKTPEPLLLLAIIAMISKKRISPNEIPMLTVLVFSFAFFSLAGHKNTGIRYLLFCIPILCVWIGRLTCNFDKFARSLPAIAIIGAAWMVISTATIWPDFLAYFNLLSGGPNNGHKYLLDSNIDWGQDLITLKKHLQEKNIPSIDLAYFGRVPPEFYGINYRLLTKQPQQKYAVISANLLWGNMYFVNATPYWPDDRDHYAYLRRRKPEAILGHTLYVFANQEN